MSLDANRLSDALFGDTVFANVIMLGAAWQQGLVPVTSDALMRAIELNGGKISIDSQLGQGTVCTVTFPIAANASAKPSVSSAA